MEQYPTTDANSKRIPNPSMPIDYGITANTVSFTSDNGTEQNRQKSKMKKTFAFSYNALNLDQYKALRDFFIARKGNIEAFLWTDPVEKVQYTVRFNMTDMTGKYFGQNVKTPLYSLEIKLKEV